MPNMNLCFEYQGKTYEAARAGAQLEFLRVVRKGPRGTLARLPHCRYSQPGAEPAVTRTSPTPGELLGELCRVAAPRAELRVKMTDVDRNPEAFRRAQQHMTLSYQADWEGGYWWCEDYFVVEEKLLREGVPYTRASSLITEGYE